MSMFLANDIFCQCLNLSKLLCVSGEGSEREMGYISSEPSLQEFMPHQIDDIDNTTPTSGIKGVNR